MNKKRVRKDPALVLALYKELGNTYAVGRKIGLSHQRVYQIVISQEQITDFRFKDGLGEIFWNNVQMDNIQNSKECWIWIGKKIGDYGGINFRGKTYAASRVSFFLYNDRWPKEACHACDNPICVNYYHIFEGTHKENMQDMALKLKAKRDEYSKIFLTQKPAENITEDVPV